MIRSAVSLSKRGAEYDDGCGLPDPGRWILLDLGGRCAAFVPEGATMTALYVVSAVLAVLLLIYLFVAMLKPEWF